MEQDYKELYEKLKSRIDERAQYWKDKCYTQFTPVNEARWQELESLRAYTIGLENGK